MCCISGVSCQVLCVRFQILGVMWGWHMSFFFFFFWGGDKVVGLVGGGSVINGPIPSRFTAAHSKYLAVELSYGG